jgi:heptosyltransferase-2
VIDRIPECPEIRFSFVEQAKTAAREYWVQRDEADTRWVGVSPGAANSQAKQWQPGRFAGAADTIARRVGAKVVVFGTASEADLGERVLGHTSVGGYNLAGKTSAREFIDLTAGCELLLTNDSGGMHVAAALGVPTIAIFGPTDEVATGPASAKALVIREPVECSPCLLKRCPIDHRCMERVSAERVASEAIAFVEGLP